MYGLKAVPFSELQPVPLKKTWDFHAQLRFPTSPDIKRREIWGTPGAPPVFRTKGSLIKIAIGQVWLKIARGVVLGEVAAIDQSRRDG